MKIKSIGVIGTGNMGEAIIRGILNEKLVSPSKVFVYDVISKKPAALKKELKINWVKQLEKLVQQSDVILLAVKPQNLSDIAKQIKSVNKKKLRIISILAGVTIKTLKDSLGKNSKVVRCMPNLAATVGESMTAVTGDKQLLSTACAVFECCGEVITLKEDFFNLITALSGSGPAYYFLLMELVTKEARKRGLSSKQALLVAKQTAKGASILASESVLDPGTLKERVTSKGGTTEAALNVFKQKKFNSIFAKAIDSAIKRGEKLGKIKKGA